jgi:Holliday junction resolvasome RuvABC endonuclease subunit
MNKNQTSKESRILAISPSSCGFGYAVMEGKGRLVAYGNMVIKKNKNARVMLHAEKIIARYQPNVLAIQDVNGKGTHRHLRIKKLHQKVITLAEKDKIKVLKLSNRELRNSLLGNVRGTKYEMAEMLAKQFPDQLASRMPKKRKDWTSEDARMDSFDAVGLTVALLMRKTPIDHV